MVNKKRMMQAVKNYNNAARNMNKAIQKMQEGGVLDYIKSVYRYGGHSNPMASMFSNPPSILNQQHSPIDGIYPLGDTSRTGLVAQDGGYYQKAMMMNTLQKGGEMMPQEEGNQDQLMSLAQSLIMGDQEAMAIYEDLDPQQQEMVNQIVQQMQVQQGQEQQQGSGNPSTDRMNELAGTVGMPGQEMMRWGGYPKYMMGGKRKC